MFRRDAVGLVGAIVSEVREQQVTFLAAAVAYYGFVSLIPLSLVALAAATVLFGQEVATFIVSQSQRVLTPAGQDLVQSALLAEQGRTEALGVGTLVLLWSGLRLFRGLDTAFSRVYGHEDPKPLPVQVRDALLVLGAIALGATAAALLGGVLPALPGVPLAALVAPVSLVVALTVVFLPVYYVFPGPDLSVREVLPGAGFAAVSWTVLTWAFLLYAASAARFQLYGVLGGALLLATWFYFAGIVIILGAVVNAVLAGRTTDDDDEEETPPDADEGPAPDIASMERDLRALEADVATKTMDRSALEADLRRYVRRRLRRGHARGWGPYLVLLYGTAMTLGAFYLLSGGWAVLAMVVVWLSTLGLYVLMLLFGVTLNAVGAPGRAVEWFRERRT